jgi:hypothetical protein
MPSAYLLIHLFMDFLYHRLIFIFSINKFRIFRLLADLVTSRKLFENVAAKVSYNLRDLPIIHKSTDGETTEATNRE